MVSIQRERLKFHSDKTDESTVAAPSDSRLGPSVVRYNMQKHSLKRKPLFL